MKAFLGFLVLTFSLSAHATQFDVKCEAVIGNAGERGVAVILTEDGKEDTFETLYARKNVRVRDELGAFCWARLKAITCTGESVLMRDGKAVDKFYSVYHSAAYKCQRARQKRVYEDLSKELQAKIPSEIRITQREQLQRILLENPDTPIIVDFWAPWCGPCLRAGETLKKTLPSWRGKAIVAKVNLSEASSLRGMTKTDYIPELHLYYSNELVTYGNTNALNDIIDRVNKMVK